MNQHAWFLTDLKTIPSNGLKVMSTFACGGGSSMGYKLAGCEVIAANDIDQEMAYNYKLNLHPQYYFLCPIRDLLTKQLPKELFSLDILDGSPPCSTFSMAGSREHAWGKKKYFREGQTKQVLSDLFFDYLDLVDHLQPKVAIAENVKGLILGNAKGYTKQIMARFKEIGYKPQLFLVNAADCGVAQTRERVFFCALRNDINSPPLQLAPAHKWISAGEATSDLQSLTDDEIRNTQPATYDLKYWPNINNGDNYGKFIEKTENRISCFNSIKLDDKKPACTLPATFDQITHWSTCRKLTYRELKRLGSFPDDYQARNDNIGKYMIGMSVPPKMTKVVAEAVISQWLNTTNRTPALT